MNKPTRKQSPDWPIASNFYNQGYNKACDDWEAYLKDVRLDEWLEEMGIDDRPDEEINP